MLDDWRPFGFESMIFKILIGGLVKSVKSVVAVKICSTKIQYSLKVPILKHPLPMAHNLRMQIFPNFKMQISSKKQKQEAYILLLLVSFFLEKNQKAKGGP